MKILICGASGFVGSRLAAALSAAGHEVIKGTRHPRHDDEIKIDYCQDTDAAIWLPRLAGIDAVVNAVGVLRDSAAQPMSKLHDTAPRALFSAAAQCGVSRIVQISALGVDAGISVPYMQTKQCADDFLQTLSINWTILRPSLIYGEEAAGTRLFTLLARLPVLVLPDACKQLVQPVHIRDLAAAVVRLFTPQSDTRDTKRIFACVGSEPVSLAGLIGSYRTQLGYPPARLFTLPQPLLRSISWLGDHISALPIGSDTLAMLAAPSTGDTGAFTDLLGRAPIPYQNFIKHKDGQFGCN